VQNKKQKSAGTKHTKKLIKFKSSKDTKMQWKNTQILELDPNKNILFYPEFLTEF
jgi:hypothetical protein